MTAQVVSGQLVLEDRMVAGLVTVEDGLITDVTADAGVEAGAPIVSPGFVDVHVHGWGGHSAMGDRAALDGMARALLRHGVTSFLPTAVAAPLTELADFAERVRSWLTAAPEDGSTPLGFNLEGPFLAPARRGAHDPAFLLSPADAAPTEIEVLLSGLRVITIAPELPGALALIAQLARLGVTVSLGHSAATLDQARDGYSAGARSTTHLFNAMTGVDHRAPGLAVAALLDNSVYAELIADGIHVVREVWPLITRLKPMERLLLVSDAIALALDKAVRNLVGAGVSLPAAVAAATRNPLDMLGIGDRGRLASGQRADLVELDADLNVRRVMRAGTWFEPA